MGAVGRRSEARSDGSGPPRPGLRRGMPIGPIRATAHPIRRELNVTPPRYKILLALSSWYYFRNLAPAVERLARDGHGVTVAAVRQDRDDFREGALELARRYPSLRVTAAPKRNDTWLTVCWDLRQAACYLHFLEPRFDRASWLRDRPRRRAPRLVQSLAGRWPLRGVTARRLLRRAAERLERAVPSDPTVERFLREERPDLVIVSPLIDLDARLWDCLKSALAMGIPTIYAVHSWDNLSSKSRLLYRPHRMLVWNQVQAEEAERYHGVPRDLISITGAQVFDEWFERRASRSRADFCAGLGFDPQRPILLYVCSALNAAFRPEPAFVLEWIKAIRGAADPRVRDANILVRPHPKREALWRDVSLDGLERVAVHPGIGELPLLPDARDLYFDSLYHSALVVGINTSALIEAGIVGRPVLTILEDGYRQDQLENFHFAYLLEVSGGLLTVAGSLAEHLDQIRACLDDPAAGRGKARAFVASFVRPHGLEQAASERFVAACLEVAASGAKTPTAPRLLDRPIRAALWPWTLMPEYVAAGVVDSVKQPKREPKYLRKAHLSRRLAALAGGLLRAPRSKPRPRRAPGRRWLKQVRRLRRYRPGAIVRKLASLF